MRDRTHDFDALYRRHAGVVFRRARTLLGSDAEAHEVVQDLFLGLFERPEQFAGKSALTTWLYSVTTHACLNRLRDAKNRGRLLREHATGSEGYGGLRPEQQAMLVDILEKLPPPLGAVAVYAFCDELTHEEISVILGCSRRQVGKLIERIQSFCKTQEAVCSAP